MAIRQFQNAIPILASLDMEKTLAFYRRLGFRLLVHYGNDYARLIRDEVELHFWGCEDPLIARNTACCVRVADAAALRREFESRSIENLSAIEQKPWGEVEFSLVDPSGNLIRFAQVTGRMPSPAGP
jgi:catechol 2,3-dioxygenase-like lactoylglutathione lyase family enzyme